MAACSDCNYWSPLKGSGATSEARDFRWPIGLCRRYPPWIECQDKSTWPATERDDWCGEHSASPALPVEGE